ncbi:RsmB/NOP family class I SAM-dependent RNA methyltransferase [bacterium]|nr:RsmB/NOP family class I SAM-dependent RNA methyltransferase [bacterium]
MNDEIFAIAQLISNVVDEKKRGKNVLNSYLEKNNSFKEFVTDIFYGSIRHYIYLEATLFKFVKKEGVSKKEKYIFIATLYVILFRKESDIPIFINDIIRGVKKRLGDRKGNFFNAVLRSILRSRDDLDSFSDDIKYSIPEKFYHYLRKNRLLHVISKMVETPKFYFRVNKNFDKSLVDFSKFRKVSDYIYRLNDNGGIKDISPFLDGKNIVIQDISAQLACHILDPKKGERILDFCAAPGTKTTLLSELSDNSSEIIAVDINQSKVDKMKTELSNYYKNISFVVSDALDFETDTIFDKILVDAPCSALGTVSKYPEKKYDFNESEISKYGNIQLKILEKALSILKIGGEILYCVCTFTPQESDMVVKNFLKRNQNIELKEFSISEKLLTDELSTIYSDKIFTTLHTESIFDGDIFFIAKFIKK